MAKSLKELLHALKMVSDEVFSYHCNDKKNDFALWIGGVFDDKSLAKRVKALNSRRELIEALSESLRK